MANHNVIYVDSLTTPLFQFDDDDVRSVSGEQSVDLVGNELPIDTLYPILEWDSVAENSEVFAPYDYDALMTDDELLLATNYTGTKNLSAIPYGTPVWYYFNENLVGKFYVKSIKRSGTNTYDMTIMSPIGLLDKLNDYGGMYSQTAFKTVLANILSNGSDTATIGTLSNGMYPITNGVFDCYVEQSVGNLLVSGYLPVATKRENLHWLLFSEAVTITKSSDGTPVFSFLLSQESPTELSSDEIYIDGSVSYDDEVTGINLTEYTYQAGSTTETIFSGSVSAGSTIVFDEPYSDITFSGITYTAYNCNYATGLSGSGTITGKKYTYTTRTIHRETSGFTGEVNEISVSNITLVNALNSGNVADRLMSFYSKAVTVDVDAVVTDGEPRSGRQYTFTNPFGSSATGFVISTEINASGNLKASCHIVTDYVPTGQGNNFSHGVLKTSGSWTVPTGITKARMVIIGGGSGGTAGEDGEDGTPCTVSGSTIDTSTSKGGEGGSAGTPGSAGKVYTIDFDGTTTALTLVPGSTISISYGAGGTSGGGSGGNTTVTANGITYSSASGSAPTNGIVNIFTGDMYALAGSEGADGGDGGDYASAGESVSLNGTTYSGGSAGGSYRETDQGSGWYTREEWQGGGGGGAAYGRSGYNGYPRDDEESADGGNGASASTPSAATYGSGGGAGSGGGGGGGGGYKETLTYVSGYSPQTSYRAEDAGAGASGSSGGSGGSGAVIIYY